MKLLFDVNLSAKLAEHVQGVFPGSTHVYRRGLGPDDDLIWEYAGAQGFVIVSKDSDFYRLSMTLGAPPKVIWLRVGNMRTADLAALLLKRVDDFQRFDADPLASFLIVK